MATQNFIPKTPEVQQPASPSLSFTPSPKKSDRPKKAKRPSLLQQVQQRRIFQREIDQMSQKARDSPPSTPEKKSSENLNSAEEMRAEILSLFVSSPGSGSNADDESTEKLPSCDRTMAFAESDEPSNETIVSDKTIAFEKTMAMDETVNLGMRNRDFDKTVSMEQTVIGDPDSNCDDEANTSTRQGALAKPIVVTPKTSRTLQDILE